MASAIAGQQSAFEQDVSAYLQALPVHLSNDEGKFALVGNGKLSGIFASEHEAMSAGYQQFGLSGFLVQEISRFDLEMGQHWLSSC